MFALFQGFESKLELVALGLVWGFGLGLEFEALVRNLKLWMRD